MTAHCVQPRGSVTSGPGAGVYRGAYTPVLALLRTNAVSESAQIIPWSGIVPDRDGANDVAAFCPALFCMVR